MKHTLRNYFFFTFFCIALMGLLAGCAHVGKGGTKDPLSLWTDTAPAKAALVSYIKNVTDKKSPDFIPVADRVAVFDLDGTLMLETDPTYFVWLLFEHRVLDDPNYKATDEQLAAARAARERGIFPKFTPALEQQVAQAYKGMSVEAFDAFVRAFMDEDQPGFTHMKRGEAFYKPMLEVVTYLVRNDFTVYVSSGTDRLIIRPLIKKNIPYIPYSQMIGSDGLLLAAAEGDKNPLSYTFEADDELILGGKTLLKNLQMNKVSGIMREVGIRPVLAFGNSLGDASMLNYARGNKKYKSLAFALCADDLEREYGNLKKAERMRQAAQKYGWIAVSMRDDWKTIYGENVKRR